jgi:hypothetical protein
LAPQVFSEDKIQVTLTWGRNKEENIDDLISIGSTKSDIVDFWTGIGILEIKDDRQNLRIFSENQFPHLEENLEKIKIENNFLNLKNFENILTLK